MTVVLRAELTDHPIELASHEALVDMCPRERWWVSPASSVTTTAVAP